VLLFTDVLSIAMRLSCASRQSCHTAVTQVAASLRCYESSQGRQAELCQAAAKMKQAGHASAARTCCVMLLLQPTMTKEQLMSAAATQNRVL
jgi:hypothetical protein